MKKQQKNLVQTRDFAIYRIPLPLNVLLKGKKRVFLYSELEKRHPCFSKDFTFNSRLVLDNKKFYSETLVMNKLKLAEYKSANPFQTLVFETQKGKRTLLEFNIEKYLLSVSLFLIFSMVLLYFGKSIYKKSSFSKLENTTEKTTELEISTALSSDLERKETVNTFFNEMEKLCGKIDAFEWNTDGFKEYLSANIRSVYPEELEVLDFVTSVVSYKEQQPYLSVKIEDFINSDISKEKIILPNVSKKDLFQSVRKCLLAYGLEIIEENYSDFSFSFKGNEYVEIGENNLFLAINEMCRTNHFSIKAIKLQKTEEKSYSNSFFGNIRFSDELPYENGIDIEKIGWRTNLIFEKTMSSKLVSSEKKSTNSAAEKKSGVKVGEIRHSDGSVSVFYKNEKGKIICIK